MYRDQYYKKILTKTIGPSFDYSYKHGAVRGFSSVELGLAGPMEDLQAWSAANPGELEKTQQEGAELCNKIDTMFNEIGVIYQDCKSTIEGIQGLDPSLTINYGNYFMSLLNGLVSKQNNLYSKYQIAYNREPYTYVEDFQELIPIIQSLVNEFDSLRTKLREGASDPDKLMKDLAQHEKDKPGGTIDSLTSLLKWAVIGGIAFIGVKTFLPMIKSSKKDGEGANQ